jgi:hypothetical protein
MNMKTNIAVVRLWLFRILLAAAAGLFLISAFSPWWHAVITHPEAGPIGTLNIYQYGIPSYFYEPQFAADITPAYQVILARIYLVVSVGLILFSGWLKGKKGQWMLGGVGLVYLAYAAVALLRIVTRTHELGILLQGPSEIHSLTEEALISIDSKILPGYYLACGVGVLCIVLASVRSIIVGKPKAAAV